MPIIEAIEQGANSLSKIDPKQPISRRKFLQGAALGASAAVVVACSSGPEATKSPDKLDPTERLFRYLDELQPSNFKDLLINHASNYFVSPTPKFVNLGGNEIKINKPDVVSIPNDDPQRNFHAHIDFFGNRPPFYKSTIDTTLFLPIPDFLLPEEIGRVTPGQLTEDQAAKIPILFDKGQDIDLSFSPVITIQPPKTVNAGEKDLVLKGEKFIYIKEMATLLGFDLWVTEMAQSLRQNKLNGLISTAAPDGTVSDSYVLPSMLSAIFTPPHDNPTATAGRLVALMDLSGYFLAFKAMEGSPLWDEVRARNKTFAIPMDTAKSTDTGANDHDLLRSAILWSLTHIEDWKLNDPNNSYLAHIGDLSKFP